MKKTVFLALVIFTVVSVFAVANTKAMGEAPPPDVVQAASDGLAFFLKNLSPQSLQRVGFSTQYEIESAKLDRGFQVLTIAPAAVVSPDAVIDRQSLIQTDTWEFLIVANGKALSLLKVALMNGRWAAVGLGSSGLAIELQSILEVWPISKAYEFRLVHVYQAGAYFVEGAKRGQTFGLIPTASARLAMGLKNRAFDPRDSYDFSDAIRRVAPAVRRNLQLDR